MTACIDVKAKLYLYELAYYDCKMWKNEIKLILNKKKLD